MAQLATALVAVQAPLQHFKYAQLTPSPVKRVHHVAKYFEKIVRVNIECGYVVTLSLIPNYVDFTDKSISFIGAAAKLSEQQALSTN